VLEEGRVALHNWDLLGGGARSMGREGFRFPMRFLPGGWAILKLNLYSTSYPDSPQAFTINPIIYRLT